MISLISGIMIFIGTMGLTVFYILSLQPASMSLRIEDKAYLLCGTPRLWEKCSQGSGLP